MDHGVAAVVNRCILAGIVALAALVAVAAAVPERFAVQQRDAQEALEFLREVTSHAPDESDPVNATLVGLLDLKALAHGGVVPVRDRPDPAVPPLATIDDWGDLPSREVSYEVPAAIVVARVDGWHRIRLADGAHGWVAPKDAGTWFPYPELCIRRLAHLTGRWNGFVWPGAGAGLPYRWPPDPAVAPAAEQPIEVHEATLVGGFPWLRIDVLSASPCDGGEVRTVLSGWVPAWDPRGEPTVWYWSRGC